VYVDGADQIWVSDFGGNAIHRFDPATESFDTFQLPAEPSEVRQILGRGNEIWGAQSADDSLVVIRPAT
jgi:virginiamycin B lyase